MMPVYHKCTKSSDIYLPEASAQIQQHRIGQSNDDLSRMPKCLLTRSILAVGGLEYTRQSFAWNSNALPVLNHSLEIAATSFFWRRSLSFLNCLTMARNTNKPPPCHPIGVQSLNAEVIREHVKLLLLRTNIANSDIRQPSMY